MGSLQQIVASFEHGDLSMEDALAKFEEGVELIRKCRTYLEETKRRVTQPRREQGSREEVAE